jgi:hypothetical protein
LVIATLGVLLLITVAFLAHRSEPVVPSTDTHRARAQDAPLAGERPSAVAPTSATTADEVDVCGYGRVERSASEEIESNAQTAAERSLGRLAVKLASSPKERESAVGLFLGPWIPQAIRDEYLQDHPECHDNQTCEEYATQLAKRKTETIVDALVRAASGSRDPEVYASALQTCPGAFGNAFGWNSSPACSALSVAHWAELEPDNGVPWLLLAQKANDATERDQAVYHASTAKRFDAYFPNFVGLSQRPEIRAEAPQTRWALADELFAIELVRPTLSYTPFLQFCNYSAVADANRVSVCSNLAHLLLDQDPTLMGFGIAVRLAQSADWPRDQLAALRDEKDAVYKAAQGRAAQKPGKGSGDCEDLARFEHWTADYAQFGQLGVARRLVDEEGGMRTQPASGGPTRTGN